MVSIHNEPENLTQKLSKFAVIFQFKHPFEAGQSKRHKTVGFEYFFDHFFVHFFFEKGLKYDQIFVFLYTFHKSSLTQKHNSLQNQKLTLPLKQILITIFFSFSQKSDQKITEILNYLTRYLLSLLHNQTNNQTQSKSQLINFLLQKKSTKISKNKQK